MRKNGKNITCGVCKKEFYISKSRFGIRKYCSKSCDKIGRKNYIPSIECRKKIHNSLINKTGNLSRGWKNGKSKEWGYTLIYQPNHPYVNNRNYVRNSHLIMEKHLGRYLKPKEIVHHINGIRDDDRIENLMLFANHSEHRIFHIYHS